MAIGRKYEDEGCLQYLLITILYTGTPITSLHAY